MKKTLTMLATCFSIVANAATINWGATSLYYGTNKTTGNDTVGYLVYLGEFDKPEDVSYASIDMEALVSQQKNYSAVADYKAPGTTTASKGKINKSVGSTALLNNIGDAIVDGSTYFGTVYVYTSGDETFCLTGGTHLYDTAHYDVAASEEFSWQTDAVPSNSDSSSQGWKAVPEPSVAIMGLLGLGMLLKRRKA